MRKLSFVICNYISATFHINTLLTLNTCYTLEFFVPLHCRNKMEMMLPREEKDSPTCTKKIGYVRAQNDIGVKTSKM